METSMRLVVGVALCLSMSSATLVAIESSLKRVLARLCPDTESAFFWSSFNRVIFVLLPLLPVLVLDLLLPSLDPWQVVRVALVTALTGMLAGLLVMSVCIGRFIVLPARNRRA